MFSFAPLVTLAVAALSVSALPVPQRNHKTISVRAAPAGWHVDYLENYDVYHERYIALSCQGRHGDAFFESCCHPLLATETLEGNREAQCNPANLPASSSAVVEVAPTTTAAAAAPASTSAAVEEEEECEVEESFSAAPAWTAAATTTAAAPAETTAAAVEAAVAPTTTAYVAPAPTTTKAAPAATTTKAAAPSGGDQKTGGFATYFLQNGNPGACGNYNPDSLPLVAITHEYYGGDAGSASSNCGKYVNIERDDGSGRSVTAIVADLCPTCVNGNSLDLSVGAFTAIADESEGMVGIKWSWA